jgi:hypothetical protein
VSVLDRLPSQDRFAEILSPVLGDDSSGVGAAAKLLEGIDPENIASSVAARLEGALGNAIPSGTASSLTSGVTSRFQQALDIVPGDPATLTAPVREVVDRILALAGDELSTRLQSGIGNFESLTSLAPVDLKNIGAEIAPAIDRVKGELLRGGMGQLREWSAGVEMLGAEVERTVASAGPTVQDALVALLARIVAQLASVVLPDAASDAERLTTPLREAVSSERLTALVAARASLEQAFRDAAAAVRSPPGGESAIERAEGRLAELTKIVSDIVTDLDTALESETTTPEGLARVIGRRLSSFENVDIIDVGTIRDTIADAIGKLEEAVRELRLERVGEAIRSAFSEIDAAIAKIDLRQFADELEQVRSEMQDVTTSIDSALVSAVASARDVLRTAREQLRAVLEEIGTFDSDGRFHFAVEDEIHDFLDGLQGSLDEAVRPLIDELRQNVGAVATEADTALQSVQDAIADVKGQLNDAVQGAVDEIEGADIPGQIEAMRNELAAMLDQLGRIDFDVVVDPVIEQIDEMADSLASIDTSSLNDLLRAALKEATKVITDIDFSQQITAALTKKMDEVLAIPAKAITDVQDRVNAAVERLGELALREMLAPLYEVYTPVERAVDQLQLAALVRPLDEWHGKAMEELRKISPEALLAPLIELHRQLTIAAEAVSPAELVRPLRDVLDVAAKAIESVPVAALAADVRELMARARAQLDALAPDQLLTPVVAEYGKIVSALEAFDPKALLRPVTEVFDRLTAPLENLSDAHAKAVELAFAPLVAMPARMDPRAAFATMASATADAEKAVISIDLGVLIVALRAAHAELRAAVAATPSAATLTTRVEALDPLRNDALGRATTALRELTTRLAQQFTPAEPPSELLARYETARPRLESLVPAWVKPPVTPESIRNAFTASSIIGVGEEIDSLYGAIKEQVRALDPSIVQEEIRESYEHLKDALLGLDPVVILDELQADLAQIAERLRTLDLELLTAELDGIAADLRGVVAGLDPRPIIDQLEELVGQVRSAVEALKPSELLADLQRPLESVKEIVHAFHPEELAAPLREGLDRIEGILKQVDLTTLLEPINDKLHELRDDLDVALDRTETAFDGMIAAIPL